MDQSFQNKNVLFLSRLHKANYSRPPIPNRMLFLSINSSHTVTLSVDWVQCSLFGYFCLVCVAVDPIPVMDFCDLRVSLIYRSITVVLCTSIFNQFILQLY